MKKEFNKSKIFAIILLLLTSVSFYYVDINSNIRQGMNVWEALFSGRFFHYYNINLASVENGEMIHPANYDMAMNVLMGIWQLPLYILEKLLKTNIQNYVLARIWGGLYPVVAIILSGNVLKRIALLFQMSEEQAENVTFMFMTATYALTSSCVVGQADSIGVLFILLALENLLKNDNKKFLLFYILVAQCKFFALFLFIPIILLKEKNLIKIALQVFPPLVISFLIDLPFKIIDPLGTAPKKSRLHNMLYEMTENRISVMGIDIPIIFILFSLICLYVYFRNKPGENECGRWYLYTGLCSMLSVFACFLTVPYWLIYISPFICILVFMEKRSLNRALFIEAIASLCLTVGFIIKFPYVYDVHNLLLAQVYPLNADSMEILGMFSDFISQYKYCDAWTLSYGIFIAWAVGFLIYYFPEQLKKKENDEKENQESSKYIQPILWLRAIGGYLICNISIFIYVILRITD